MLLGTTGGAQESQLEGGSQRLPDGLAQQLGTGRLTLSSPVRRVVQDGNECSCALRSRDGARSARDRRGPAADDSADQL